MFAKLLRCILIALTLALFMLLLNINQGIASFASAFFPQSAPFVHGGLLLLECALVFWLWRSLFGGSANLRFPNNPTPEQREEFTRAITARLRYNPHLDHDKLNHKSPDFLPQALEQLKAKADLEIKRTAERVFLATALSQNGRIDAIIVFAVLCRLVWRISRLYNQRPHPSEILNIYGAVVTATFVALSFEELDIATEISVGFGEAFHAMAPAAVSGSVPLVGTALQKFTSSAIDGAANGYLALRAGIICRNAYMYSVVGQERPARVTVYKEAGGVLMTMANGLINQVMRSFSDLLWGITKKAPCKTAHAVAGGLTNSAGRAAEAVAAHLSRFTKGI